MESPDRNRTQQQQHEDLADSGDSFEFREDFPDDEQSLTDGEEEEEEEEDMEAAVKAIQDRAPASRKPCPTGSDQLSVIDFLRSFLVQQDMTETLECLEAEWSELVHKGEVDEKRIDPVPEVYTENQRLDGELKNALLEEEECRRTASAAAAALQRAQRSRDAHRLQHQRVVREKNRLIGEIRKLKVQCDSLQPEVKRMSEKCQAVSKQVLQMASEKEPLQGGSQDLSLPDNEGNGLSK